MKLSLQLRPVLTASAALVCATLLGAPAQAQNFDPQLLQQLIQQQLIQQRLMPGGSQQAAQARPAALPTTTEQALAQQLEDRAPAQGPFEVEKFRDGFSINKQRILDPEGQITKFAVDDRTGDYAYLVQGLPGQFTVKLARHQVGQAISVATVVRQGSTWMVETATGQRLNGARLLLHPQGVLIARDSVVFGWTAGKGLQNYSLPETHLLAAHQNGDIGTTGWVLLEKRQETKREEGGVLGGTSLGQLVGSMKRLGSSLGINGSDTDYAMYHLASQKLVPLGIAMEEKFVQVASACQQGQRWIPQCDRLDSFESVYNPDGSPNRAHYYWRVSWYRTPAGTVAVSMEDGIRKIEAIRLETGARATVFERTLGIGAWSARQTPDGRVRVQAQLGFESAVKEDAAEALATAGPESLVAQKTAGIAPE